MADELKKPMKRKYRMSAAALAQRRASAKLGGEAVRRPDAWHRAARGCVGRKS